MDQRTAVAETRQVWGVKLQGLGINPDQSGHVARVIRMGCSEPWRGGPGIQGVRTPENLDKSDPEFG
jgi:hypothetical protein